MERTFVRDKYWLKRARVAGDCLDGGDAGLDIAADGTALADIRIEDGIIRAVMPAGAAPCCCRGVDLGGASVHPLAEGGRIAAGWPADLRFDCMGGCVVLRRGRPDGTCALGLECVCTPPVQP